MLRELKNCGKIVSSEHAWFLVDHQDQQVQGKVLYGVGEATSLLLSTLCCSKYVGDVCLFFVFVIDRLVSLHNCEISHHPKA